MKGFIPIQEVREYYLFNCSSHLDDVPTMMWGKKTMTSEVQPTLTGWVKYWREYIKKYPQVIIIYKSNQR